MLKRAIATTLVVTMLAPVPAYAEEEDRAPVMLYSHDVLTRSPLPLVTPASSITLDPKMAEIRLTRGEKIAIIVTACVVGALILIFAVGRPHKHL